MEEHSRFEEQGFPTARVSQVPLVHDPLEQSLAEVHGSPGALRHTPPAVVSVQSSPLERRHAGPIPHPHIVVDAEQ
jgi:hypothetical protein